MISLLLTFCLWECDKRSENGDWCGSSNANKANVRSSSSSTAGSSSPLSANCSEENLMASSTRLSRINSISCCCYRIDLVKLNRQIQTYSKNTEKLLNYFYHMYTWRWKNRYLSSSKSSGWSWWTRAVASEIFPAWMQSLIFMRLSIELRSEFLSPSGNIPASKRNFSAASLNPSLKEKIISSFLKSGQLKVRRYFF